MFGVGHRTPAKSSQSPDPNTQKPKSPQEKAVVEAGPSVTPDKTDSLTKVRRSIGEWEKGRAVLMPMSPGTKAKVAHSPQKQKLLNTTQTQSELGTIRKTTGTTPAVSMGVQLENPKGRVAEAKACLIKAKLQINSSRNLKAEIKAEVIQAVEKLYRLVKEAEAAKPSTPSPAGVFKTGDQLDKELQEALTGHSLLMQKNIEVTSSMIKELKQQSERVVAAAQDVGAVKDQIDHIKVRMDECKVLEGISYAAVAANIKPMDRLPKIPEAIHTVVVSSENAHDTSEDVLNKIRTAVSAKTSGIRVDKMRKARDQKVVLGCRSREEITKVMEKLRTDSPTLQIKEVENRDPLIILFGVLLINTDEEVLSAFKRQNRHILGSIPEEDYRASVRFRRKARNPLENHVILQVSPRVWRSVLEEGKVHIDLQRVVVKDQSPLLTCSRCLGYGHGRKTCQEAVDTCSHCTGPHLRNVCPAWQAGTKPTCSNCRNARLDRTDHNSFDGGCPIRKKWDALARAKVAYC